MSGSTLLVFTNFELISSGQRLRGQALHIRNGVIVDIVPETAPHPTRCNVMDLGGNLMLPGLIDLQIYGSGNSLFGGHPAVAGLREMEVNLSRQGVTGFLATIATNTTDVMEIGIESAHAFQQESIGNFWGLHLEGPYLSPARRGAHPAELIVTPAMDEVKELIHKAQGCIRMMTIAPERVDPTIMHYLESEGVVLSAGHSNATYEEGKQFIHNPIRTVTHLYNAMPGLHHRDLSFLLAVFEDKPFASIVADGIHVAYPMIKLAKRELREKLFLITDAVTHSSSGIYPHILQNNDRYVMPDGTLSGSALTMLKAVQNCVKYCNISLEEAVNMATLYPAQVLKVSEKKGSIKVGCDADLCVMNADFEVVYTYIGGKCVYLAADEN